MGNEASHLSGLEIDDKATEITDFWSQYQATISDSCRYFSLKGDGSVSVFKGGTTLGPLWAVSTPLEKFSNNLIKYRHPCIVRYISVWQQKSIFHLATEFVQPLVQVLYSLTPLQICIGLNNILRALVFLHDQAGMSHNNVSISAIYVTGDGQWKLGGLQYLCSFQELTPAYLKHARLHRYDKAIDPNEDSYEITSKVDQYGFGVLVEDVYQNRKDEVPYLKEFKKFCKEKLQHQEPAKRPSLSEVLQHNFFNHEFITIYKFLNFLPLKGEEERNQFFSNILDNLKCYDEETVAKQLSGLLLSRVTMLDTTARKRVIPFILKPKNERTQNEENKGFFSMGVFKEHVKPRLMQLFAVRDNQIRMLLLTHFTKFVHVFSHEELSQHILPELLLGIKDTDDSLVASTLMCLSDLVPILGADTVIGGKRSKLFTDGRPNSSKSHLLSSTPAPSVLEDNSYLTSKSLKDFTCSEEVYEAIEQNSFENALLLNERPSPVGGESVENEVILQMSNTNVTGSEDGWSDWDNSNHKILLTEPEQEKFPDTVVHTKTFDASQRINDVISSTAKSTKSSLMQEAALEAKKNILDITELDIKNQKFDYAKRNSEELDYFADMTPVIEKQTVATINTPQSISSKLNFIPNEEIDENEGWGDNWN